MVIGDEVDLPTGENLLLLKMGFGEVKRDLNKMMIMCIALMGSYAFGCAMKKKINKESAGHPGV